MEDPEDAERDRRNRERFVIVFTVWAEDIRDRLETDASFFRRVEAS